MNNNVLRFTGIALTLFLISCSTSQNSSDAPSFSGLSEDQSKLVRMANKMRENGDYQTALKFYLQVANQEAETSEVVFGMADCYSKLGQGNEALSRLLDYKAAYPDHPLINRELGKVYLSLNEPKQCIKYFSAALETQPNDIITLNGLGVCNDLVKNHEAAQKYYLNALDINPKATYISANLGLSYTFSGQTIHQAITILGKIANSPDATPKDRQNLALAYGLSGDLKKAAEIFSIDLNDEEVENNLAYIRNKRQQDAFTPPSHATLRDEKIEMHSLQDNESSKKKQKKNIKTLIKKVCKTHNQASISENTIQSSNDAQHDSAVPTAKETRDAFMKQPAEKTTTKTHESGQEVRTIDDSTRINALDDTDLLEAEALLM
jgi:Flp pilus assembly protein TadD